jgi:NAD(P)-dependent dehydrogenase (short-subunit alcohol dehydrogenase family)
MCIENMREAGRWGRALCRGHEGSWERGETAQAFFPLLGGDKGLRGPPGRIVMISSIGSWLPGPYGSSYSAAKAALDAFSGTLRVELLHYGIDVIVLGKTGLLSTPR